MSAARLRTHSIVIVGGGAGGLELATALARGQGRDVLLVDRHACHVWKPRLHEVAAGHGPGQVDEISYATLAEQWGFAFRQGELLDVLPDARMVRLAPVCDEDGHEIAPAESIGFQALVLAVGGVTPDLGVEGVAEHAFRLDDLVDAGRIFKTLSRGLLARVARGDSAAFDVVIAGSGATGVELASHLVEGHQCNTVAPRRDLPEVRVTMLEAMDGIMPGMADDVRANIRQRLEGQGVRIVTAAQVSRVTPGAVETEDGATHASDLTVWTTGTVGPEIASRIGALPTNDKRQWLVRRSLQSKASEAVFALGDCAVIEESPAPPTAQAASEQAAHLSRTIPAWLGGAAPEPFEYRNRGTVLSLAEGGSVAKFKTGFSDDLMINGRLARAAYRGLYRQHQFRILGRSRERST